MSHLDKLIEESIKEVGDDELQKKLNSLMDKYKKKNPPVKSRISKKMAVFIVILGAFFIAGAYMFLFQNEQIDREPIAAIEEQLSDQAWMVVSKSSFENSCNDIKNILNDIGEHSFEERINQIEKSECEEKSIYIGLMYIKHQKDYEKASVYFSNSIKMFENKIQNAKEDIEKEYSLIRKEIPVALYAYTMFMTNEPKAKIISYINEQNLTEGTFLYRDIILPILKDLN